MVRVGIVVVVLAACSTTSQTGSFVRDVQFVDAQLLVTSCDVRVTVTQTLTGGANETAAMNGCTYDRIRLPSDDELVLGAPEGCEASAERWYAATTAEPAWSRQGRLKLWRTLPRACRAFLEERSR